MTAAMVTWDEWRAAYDEWTFEEQAAFYAQVHDEYPGQARFDAAALGRLLGWVGGDVTVVELGGWDGGFAAAILPNHPQVKRWTNYEICGEAVRGGVCDDPRYEGISLREWYWDTPHAADVFVASHVLEHLRLRDVRRTLDATVARFAYIQCPVDDASLGARKAGPPDWNGYPGTHILEVGWDGLQREFEARGWRLLPNLSSPSARCFEWAA